MPPNHCLWTHLAAKMHQKLFQRQTMRTLYMAVQGQREGIAWSGSENLNRASGYWAVYCQLRFVWFSVHLHGVEGRVSWLDQETTKFTRNTFWGVFFCVSWSMFYLPVLLFEMVIYCVLCVRFGWAPFKPAGIYISLVNVHVSFQVLLCVTFHWTHTAFKGFLNFKVHFVDMSFQITVRSERFCTNSARKSYTSPFWMNSAEMHSKQQWCLEHCVTFLNMTRKGLALQIVSCYTASNTWLVLEFSVANWTFKIFCCLMSILMCMVSRWSFKRWWTFFTFKGSFFLMDLSYMILLVMLII